MSGHFDHEDAVERNRRTAPFRGDKTDGPSFCWHCNRQLMYVRGGAFAFAKLRDRGGAEHRVHGDCVHPATTDDHTLKEIRP